MSMIPIESLPAGASASRSRGGSASQRPGAPPGFSSALDDAAKTWTARAEGQNTSGSPLDIAAATQTSRSTRSADAGSGRASAEPQVPSGTVRAGRPQRHPVADDHATTDAPAAKSAPAADDDGTDAAADAIRAAAAESAQADPATPLSGTAQAVAAAAVFPIAPANTPALTTDGQTTTDATLAKIAGEVTDAAAAAAKGAPVDPAAPGVAELLASVASGETDAKDLPASVQALVAKATAAQAKIAGTDAGQAASGKATGVDAATAATAAAGGAKAHAASATAPAPDAKPANAKALAAAGVAAAAAQAAAATSGTPATPAATTDSSASVAQPATQTDAPAMSPLAAAIQAAANQAQAGSGAGNGSHAAKDQGKDAQAAAIAATAKGDAPAQPVVAHAAAPAPDATPAAAAAGAQAAPATQPAAPSQAPAPAATPATASPIAVAPATTAVQSTAAVPAVPTVQVANPGAQTAAIEALVHLSRQRGHSSARIALAPEQLGGIQVTLMFGPDGVTARMIADRPEAAAALNRAGQDLKDSLQSQGIDLAGLETSFAGSDGQRQDARSSFTAQGQPGRSGSHHHAGGRTADDTILHLALDETPAPQPLAAGRTIDLRA